jgi:4-alpha-glucanotransferase
LTSLPGPFGIGDLGPCACEFADFLFAAGQKLWQVLPLNPTGYGDSPYQCFSAFAGNPMLLSIERLRGHTVLASVADVAIVPLQLGLGTAARMNLPGKISGNWKWRYRAGALSAELSQRLRFLVTLYDR